MNDPGLDEPISTDAKDVENQKEDEQDEREEDEQAFLEPRYVGSVSALCQKVKTRGRGDTEFLILSNTSHKTAGPFELCQPAFLLIADYIYLQPMVVRPHSFSTHSWNLRAHGISVQYMCPRRTLESIHTPGSSRTEWRSNRGSKVVRSILMYPQARP